MPFGHFSTRVIAASSGGFVSVKRPSESVISDGSFTVTPLLSIRRTKISKRLMG
jgi:hypothetical protein